MAGNLCARLVAGSVPGERSHRSATARTVEQHRGSGPSGEPHKGEPASPIELARERVRCTVWTFMLANVLGNMRDELGADEISLRIGGPHGN